jgi:Predicted membrane protein
VVSHYLLDRVTSGAIVTALTALAGYKARTLTRSGAAAGFAAGTIAIAAGWSWGFLLLGLFVTASVLSRFEERKKELLVCPVVEKGGERDAWQVAANGSVYVAAAAALIASGRAEWYAMGIGALAASAADTWSTEIGTFGGRVPRLIVSGKRAPPGTSGVSQSRER